MKSKTKSRLSGVAPEGTRIAFVFLLVPNPVPKLALTGRGGLATSRPIDR
jgi:hypothetical protein